MNTASPDRLPKNLRDGYWHRRVKESVVVNSCVETAQEEQNAENFQERTTLPLRL